MQGERSDGVNADEMMECERWGADEGVEMDIDLSAEEELCMLSEISHTRGRIMFGTASTSLQLPPLSIAPCYTVRKATTSVEVMPLLSCLFIGEVVPGIGHKCSSVTPILSCGAERFCH